MSNKTTYIDERVVEMKFDNADFQKKTAETMSTLEKLKKSLNLDGFKGLKNVSDAAKNFDLSGANKSIEECSNKFSALEIAGVTAIAKITSSAMDMGARLVKSMSIDQVTAGFDRYAQKTSAVQTIMAATAKDFSNTAEQMEVVNGQLEELSWFTDETSYSFTDMVSNIGKFTSNNVKLNDAVSAMQGIATWAAISGANITDANRAMYNMSQAIGAGAVKLIDWKSIENANMATYDFKKNVADTAVQIGTLKKVGEDTYSTLSGDVFTLAQFNSELSKGWFNSEVLITTLNKYGGATKVLHELYEQTGMTTSRILELAEDFKKGGLDIQDVAKDTGASAEDLTKLFTELTDAQNELGLKAFKAAQEAKTFREAIDATAEAVSSKWMQTFELIFGNYEEAKVLWTGVANALYDSFAATGDTRNEILAFWKEEKDGISGRNELIRGMVNLFNLLVKPIRTVKKALSEAFNFDNARKTADTLRNATKAFADFTEKLQPTETVLKGIYLTFQAFSEVGKTIFYVFKEIATAIFPSLSSVKDLNDSLFKGLQYVSAYVIVISRRIRESGKLTAVINAIGSALRNVFTILAKVGAPVLKVVVKAISVLANAIANLAMVLQASGNPFARIGEFFKQMLAQFAGIATVAKQAIVSGYKVGAGFITGFNNGAGFHSPIKRITEFYKTMTSQFRGNRKVVNEARNSGKEVGTGYVSGMSNGFETLGKVMTAFGHAIASVGKAIVNGLMIIVAAVAKAVKAIVDYVTNAFKESDTVLGGFANLFKPVSDSILNFIEKLGGDRGKIEDFFRSVNKGLGEFVHNLSIGKIMAIVFGVALLSMIGNIAKFTDTITGAIKSTKGLIDNVNNIIKKKFVKSSPIVDTAKAITMVALSLALLADAGRRGGLKEATLALGALTTIIGSFALAISFLDKQIKTAGFESSIPQISRSMIMMAGAIGILSLAIAVLSKAELSKHLADLGVAIGAVVVICGVLVGSMKLLSMFAPELVKNSLSLLVMAGAVAILAAAVKRLADITITDPAGISDILIELIGGLIALSIASSKVSLKGALGILVIAAAMKKIVPAIEQISKMMQELATNISNAFNSGINVALGWIAATITFFGALFVLSKTVTPMLNAIGNAALGIGVGVLALTVAVRSIKEFVEDENVDGKTIFKAVVIVGVLTILMSAINAFMSGVGKRSKGEARTQFLGMAAYTLAFAGALKIMSSALEQVADIPDANLSAALKAILALEVMMTAIMYAMSKIKGAKTAIAAMVAFVGSLATLLVALGILSLFKPQELIAPTIALVAVLGALSSVFNSLSKVKPLKAGTITAMVGTILVLSGALVTLAAMAHQDIGAVITACAGMSVAVALLAKLVKTISSSSGLGNASTAKNKAIMLLTITGAIVALGGAMTLMALQPWDQMLAAGAAMSGALLALSTAVYILGQIKPSKDFSMVLVAVGVMTACIIGLAGAAVIMNGINVGAFAAQLGIMVGAIGLLSVIIAFLGGAADAAPMIVPAILAISTVILSLAASFVAFGASIALASVGFGIVGQTLVLLQGIDLVSLGLGLGVIGASMMVLGLASAGMIPAAAGIAAIGAAILVLSAAVGLSVKVLEGFGVTATKFVGFLKGVVASIGGFVGKIKSFFSDIAKTMGIGSAKLEVIAEASGENIGSGYETGFREGAQWHSPPKWLVKFLADAGLTLNDDWTVAKAAAANGEKAGNSWGVSIWNSLSTWLKDIIKRAGEALGGLGSTVSSLTGNIVASSEAMKGYNGMPSSVVNTITSAEYKSNKLKNSVDGLISSEFDLGDISLDVNDYLKDQEEQMNKLTESMDIAGGSAGGLGESLDGAGGSAKKSSDKIKELSDTIKSACDVLGTFKSAAASDPFGEVTNSMDSMIKPDKLLGDMKAQNKVIEGWMDGIQRLIKRGVSNKLIKYLEEMGVEGRYKVQAFVDMTEEQLKEAEANFEKLMNPKIDSQRMIDSMQQQLNAVKEWANNIQTLAQRGINKPMLEELQKLGPSAAGEIQAFVNMTDEQLQQATALYAESLTMPTDLATMIYGSYNEIGDMTVSGLAVGMTNNRQKAMGAAASVAKAVTDVTKQVFGIHSPSKVFEEIGKFDMLGLGAGFTKWVGDVNLTIMGLCNRIIITFTAFMPPSRFYTIGEQAMQGLINGINAKGAEAVNAARSIAQQCAQIVPHVWDERSPSHLMEKYGKFFALGGAIGINKSAKNVYDAAHNLASGAVDAVSGEFGRIDELADFNLHPVITLEIDTSNVRRQLAEINSMFKNKELSASASIQNENGSANASGTPQVNFTQINNSPKAISRTEVYRYGNNAAYKIGEYIKR